jgi:uncharacterized protein YndB with AHSA1/START domain
VDSAALLAISRCRVLVHNGQVRLALATQSPASRVQGQFLELIPGERIVQLIEFESKAPAFAGPMTIKWTPADVPGGTEVTILCENVPEGIRHEAGIRSSLESLAAFTE